MTAAARQRRHRLGLSGAVTKPTAKPVGGLLRELGWLGLNDVSEAISELMVEETDDESMME